MFSYFRCELMGIVTSDLNVRNRRNGSSLVKFEIGIRNPQGEVYSQAVVAKDDLARHVLAHVKKGSVVVTHGFLSSFVFVDDQNEEQFVQEVVLNDLVAFNRHEQQGFSPGSQESLND